MANFAFLICRRDFELFERLLVTITTLDDSNHCIYIYCSDNSKSITSANNNMLSRIKSDGLEVDYYIFVHEDVVILNSNLLNDVCRIFGQNSNIEIMGVAGVKTMPVSQIFWSGDCWGQVLEDRGPGLNMVLFQQPQKDYEPVEMVDGLCIISNTNREWNEQIGGFHFYDASYCKDAILRSKNVVIPKQESPWFVHAAGYRAFNSGAYDAARDNYKKVYGL